ncbi:carboxypeptidase-like regulatory domain-containing protein [uncultured Draconibacterium sp.]|uniref:carboxypeptidase-like regulatory domain-containing protein n=1 Tax=uncultured Draconibacterium sp. TaxID=1573823 RepID=UPI0025FED293|nr:carboxypeptidase-like regulatory domain-containing protein [uncultured Draconibacterium sp.]
MIPAKFSLSLLFFCILTTSVFSQQTISGRITDAETNLPIRHAEVFVSGTTVGVITDTLGNFSIKVPFMPCTLVADHVSYESYIQAIENQQQLDIELVPSNFSLDEVSISAKDKRRRNLRYFYDHFLGESPEKTKVLNDSVLVFQRDKMQFSATSNEPLLVENNYLGYRIKVILDEFKVIVRDGPNGKQLALNSPNGGDVIQLKGYYYYEPLEVEQPSKTDYFAKNRRLSYHGSYRHFLKSIFDNNPGEQGYEIKIFPEEQKAAFYLIENEELSSQAKEYIILADKLEIHYRFDEDDYPIPEEFLHDRFTYSQRNSVFYPVKAPFLIRSNGTSPNLNFVIDGAMKVSNFSNSLPEDYTPPKR